MGDIRSQGKAGLACWIFVKSVHAISLEEKEKSPELLGARRAFSMRIVIGWRDCLGIACKFLCSFFSFSSYSNGVFYVFHRLDGNCLKRFLGSRIIFPFLNNSFQGLWGCFPG